MGSASCYLLMLHPYVWIWHHLTVFRFWVWLENILSYYIMSHKSSPATKASSSRSMYEPESLLLELSSAREALVSD